MSEYPTNPVMGMDSTGEYGSMPTVPEPLKSLIQKHHDKLTIKQLRECSDFFNKCADNFRTSLDSNITIEDFEKAKKIDADGDNEQGEK